MNQKEFKKENEKYSYLWQNNYKEANWKRFAKKAVEIAKSINENAKIIDLGIGNGKALEFFTLNGLDVSGVDISSYAVSEQKKKGYNVYQASLDDLSVFQDNAFDIGFCNDVIEHLPEKLVKPALDEMSRICSTYLLISACPSASHYKSKHGENLHLCVKPVRWWKALFKNYGKVQRARSLFSRSARFIITL